MPFNGSGNFSIPNTFVYDTIIDEVTVNANFSDIATGLSTCLTTDGQSIVSANIPMATYRFTNVGAAVNATDYARADQIQSNALTYFTASGTNTYTISPSPAITAYAAGQSFLVKFTNANTGAATLNANALGAKDIRDRNGNALTAGLIPAGSVIRCDYDGTRFVIDPANWGGTYVALTGDQTVAGEKTFTSPTTLNNSLTRILSTAPRFRWEESDGTSTHNITDLRLNGDVFALETRDSAGTSVSTDYQATKTSTGVSEHLWRVQGSTRLTVNSSGATVTGTLNATTELQENGVRVSPILNQTRINLDGATEDFTGIPSGVRRVNIMIQAGSTNGTSNPLIQIGPVSGFLTSTYLGSGTVIQNAASPSVANYTTGFGFPSNLAANVFSGVITLTLQNAATNTWVCTGILGFSNTTLLATIGGVVSLSGALERVRITTVGGTDLYDNGTVNISWEF